MQEIEKGYSYLSSPDITPQNKKIRHLRIVISDFDEMDRALVVPISTWYENSHTNDDSCIIEKGEHPFITHKSFASYSRCESMSYEVIKQNIERNIFIPKDSVSQELLKRLQDGAKKSIFIPQTFEHFFLDF